MTTDSLSALAHASRRTTVINEWVKVTRIANLANIEHDENGPGIDLLGRVIDAFIDDRDSRSEPETAWRYFDDEDVWPTAAIIADRTVANLTFTQVAAAYAGLSGWRVEEDVEALVKPRWEATPTIERMRLALYFVLYGFGIVAGDVARNAVK